MVTSDQMRALEVTALENGWTEEALMEAAGRGVAATGGRAGGLPVTARPGATSPRSPGKRRGGGGLVG